MKQYVLALACAALLAGCGSSVKLDDVAVEDRSGKPVAGQAGAAGAAAGSGGAAGVANSAIAPVTLPPAGGSGSVAAAMASGPRVVYFDYDSFAIKPEFQAIIETQARVIKADKSLKVSVEGHTDERGGREYNLALGQKRSEAVRRALGLLGVPDAQVEAVSYGKEKPAVQGMDEAALAKNRRAEITYR